MRSTRCRFGSVVAAGVAAAPTVFVLLLRVLSPSLLVASAHAHALPVLYAPFCLLAAVCVPSENSASDMKETTSLTLKESAAFLAGNDYLRDVAILVIAYGTSINIVEGGWVGGWVGGYFRWLVRPTTALVSCSHVLRRSSLNSVGAESACGFLFTSTPPSLFWEGLPWSYVGSCHHLGHQPARPIRKKYRKLPPTLSRLLCAVIRYDGP